MSGRWVASLPDVSFAPIEDLPVLAIMDLGRAMGVQLPSRRLNSVRYAAAFVRAWRLSLPAHQQWERTPDWNYGEPDDSLLRSAGRYMRYAAAKGSLEGAWLRDAEAALRTVGKRWARELES